MNIFVLFSSNIFRTALIPSFEIKRMIVTTKFRAKNLGIKTVLEIFLGTNRLVWMIRLSKSLQKA